VLKYQIIPLPLLVSLVDQVDLKLAFTGKDLFQLRFLIFCAGVVPSSCDDRILHAEEVYGIAGVIRLLAGNLLYLSIRGAFLCANEDM
jgi:hypothetical protein